MFKDVLNDIGYKFSLATGLAVLVTDIHGNEISPRFNFTDFCLKVRSYDHLCETCMRCDVVGGLESLRVKSTTLYRCHTGLIDFSIPVVINETLVAFVMCGQVKVASSAGIPSITNHCNNWRRYDDLVNLYEDLPLSTTDKISAAYDILNDIIAHAIPSMDGFPSNAKTNVNTILSAHQNSYNNNKIEIAISYINNNLSSNLSLDNVSYHAGISRCHFSRQFKEYQGIGFSAYVTQQRIGEAKALLATTCVKICDIAKRVGFNSTSYFSKKFTTACGVTPEEFRSMNLGLNWQSNNT
ncbi:PocR ligand-binding domain-containing protein [Thaumasiovibrio sp. DFM-14]|uniref:PocR ligand-binding domain-containing protein n=1 Tax=Thaumasiovibrio sp. DFM-14 TaxID=3384792 RepID=UPI0039A1A8E4